MTVQTQVQNAANPQEALLVIARALDVITTKLDKIDTSPKDDSWGEWTPPDEDNFDESRKADRIAQLRAKLEVEKDPEEIQAIASELKLLSDKGKVHGETDNLPKGDRVQIVEEDGALNVIIPPPNEEQLEKRELFADEVLAVHYGWEEEHLDAFKRGGPLLLYYNEREMVRTLPPLWIRQFIEDVEVNSPEEAHEMARDLLKDVEADNMQDLTVENLKRDIENL
jgi:hypothetical protein